MNKEQIAHFCERYFTATGSHLIEKSPIHMKVKLSPDADRDLTGRSYYWNFVERTGAEAETMSFMFIFDPEAREKEKEADSAGKAQPGSSGNSILGRYFGMPPSSLSQDACWKSLSSMEAAGLSKYLRRQAAKAPICSCSRSLLMFLPEQWFPSPIPRG